MPAAVSSCPERRNNGEAVGEGDWEEGARVSRKGETKEPRTDCHLHVTRSLPAPFFLPLVPAAVGLENALYTQMLGFSSRFSAARPGRSAPGCPNL